VGGLIGRHILLFLTIALAPAFAVTALVTNAYRSDQSGLARSWSRKGDAALDSGRPADAIEAFRNALAYARDDRAIRLRLAQALAAAGRRSEARAYLLALWDDQPGNGPVNLELARIAADDRDLSSAIRYYHNAIEGAWANGAADARRAARLELAEFLIEQGATAPAQAELIALAGELPGGRNVRLKVAGLMSRAGLSIQALGIYRGLLAQNRADPEALIGAGESAFDSASYPAAVAYLSAAERLRPLGARQATLEIARLVVTLDPFQPRVSSLQRARRTIQSFDAASERLAQCPNLDRSGELAALDAERAALGPKITPQALRRDPDLIDTAMDLAFRIERATGSCGSPRPVDRALLLIARRHEEPAS
jgi:tetratricopeptide (TPR) repeat protein